MLPGARVLSTAIASALTLALNACGPGNLSDDEARQIVEKYLAGSPGQCIHYFTLPKNKQGYGWVIEPARVTYYQKIGLLTVQSSSYSSVDFTLTEEGSKYYNTRACHFVMGCGAFCVGRKKLVKVSNVVLLGENAVDVNYVYFVGDVPGWASQTENLGWLKDSDKRAVQGQHWAAKLRVVRSSKGWIAQPQ